MISEQKVRTSHFVPSYMMNVIILMHLQNMEHQGSGMFHLQVS